VGLGLLGSRGLERDEGLVLHAVDEVLGGGAAGRGLKKGNHRSQKKRGKKERKKRSTIN